MAEKRYYWMKMPADFFEDDIIDWLMEQPNGKDYVVFYIKLCLKAIKTEGVLIRAVGNLLVPYDAKKLAELTRTEVDTVVVALKLLQQTGLIEILENGELYLTALKSMIGSETNKASSMRRLREERKEGNNVTPALPNCYPEKEKEKEKKKEKKESNAQRRFIPPTPEEILEYCREKNLEYLEPQAFIDFYESKGWVVGSAKMKDWKAAARRWNRGNEENHKPKAKWALEEQKGVRQSSPENDELNRRLASMGG